MSGEPEHPQVKNLSAAPLPCIRCGQPIPGGPWYIYCSDACQEADVPTEPGKDGVRAKPRADARLQAALAAQEARELAEVVER